MKPSLKYIYSAAALCVGIALVFIVSKNDVSPAASENNERTCMLASPPPGYLYHGVHITNASSQDDKISSADLSSYEQIVGKTAAWVDIPNHWFQSREFPLTAASWIRDTGSIPFIRLMLWSAAQENRQEPLFTLDEILKGTFDNDLQKWAQSARAFASPIIVDFGPEVNGSWYPWNGWWNGRDVKVSYGDPSYPDGPERFRDAYRHIINLMRHEKVINITWVFHVNYNDYPGEDWNRFENYYPGDDYIDWIGISVYGAQQPASNEWPGFSDIMHELYPRLSGLSALKPIVLVEFGVAQNNPLGSQALWVQQTLTDLVNNRWPRIIGFSWWNKAWQNNSNPHLDTTMRVQDNPSLAIVFQNLVGKHPHVLGRIKQKQQ